MPSSWESRLAELMQMRSAPSDSYSAGEWCEALNDAVEIAAVLHEALVLVDDPYPIEVFPELRNRDEVFAAMREVNKFATEQFYAEAARQRGRVAREHVEKFASEAASA